MRLRVGAGCEHCRGTGFKGRKAIVEILNLNDEIREFIISRQPLSLIREVALDMVSRGEPRYRRSIVSLLFRDELRVVLTPEQVLMVRIKRAMTYRGLRRKVLEKKAVLCAAYAAGGTQWGAALQALEAALTVQAGRKAFATVVLSNHFMRYALLPWSDVPVSEDEEMSYARHTFRQAYGDAAESWELRLSPGRIGQPHLMTAYNACRPSFGGKSAWFALLEPGSLCLALLRHGSWESVRTTRMDGDGRVALPLMLEREAYLRIRRGGR